MRSRPQNRRADLPYQFALAEAFTICDAYHCSATTGTVPNRIMF
jgi:phospholipase C